MHLISKVTLPLLLSPTHPLTPAAVVMFIRNTSYISLSGATLKGPMRNSEQSADPPTNSLPFGYFNLGSHTPETREVFFFLPATPIWSTHAPKRVYKALCFQPPPMCLPNTVGLR